MNSMTPSNETHYALDLPPKQKWGTMLGAMCSLAVAKHAVGIQFRRAAVEQGAGNIKMKHGD